MSIVYTTHMLNLKIVTPERTVFEDSVDEVIVPGADGEMGILPHHINIMAKLLPGELRIKRGNKSEVLAVGGGFLQMADNTATILTDMALEESSIDEKAAEEARKRASEALEQKLSDEEYAETISILERSLAQLKVKRRHRVR